MKSVILASMHKAGSTVADQITTEVCRERGLVIEKISKLVSTSPEPEREVFIGYQRHMQPEGFYYGVARGAYVADMPFLFRIRLIVQIRDPRDCLTSSYFSRAISHVPPRNPEKLKEFEKKRASASKLTIDAYALSRIQEYKVRMSVLRKFLETHPEALLLKYEDMVERTEFWLGQLGDFMQQPLTKPLRSRLEKQLDFSTDGEDPSKHKRQVTPGDHIRKLQPETIAALNKSAQTELTYFGYI